MMTPLQLRKVLQEIDNYTDRGPYELTIVTSTGIYRGPVHTPNIEAGTIRIDRDVVDGMRPTWIAIHTIESIALV